MATTDTAPRSNRRAFERTILPHMDAMYGRAVALTHNPAEAEDLVQESLIRALKFFHSYDPEQSPRAWLFTIVKNTFVNRWHALNRQRDAQAAVKADAQAMSEGEAPLAEAVLVAADVRAAVDALPEQFAAVIRLVDLQGLGYYEAADELGVPKGTVMSRLHRGRAKLRALLEAA
jgi:RNA polymerase sigma-70 factor (ECF subfamily)